jgi:ferritin-like metal-binding protein YciE
MGLFTRDIKTMNDLFVHQLQDIYYAEKQLVKALPKMADKATDKELKQGFLTHLEETKTHVQRLEEVFRMFGTEVKAVDCPAIDGIIEEADEVAGEVADKSVLDAALINAGQAAEHYEIARYGSLIAWARQLGRTDCASLLQKTLDGADHRQEADLARRGQDQSSRGKLSYLLQRSAAVDFFRPRCFRLEPQRGEP